MIEKENIEKFLEADDLSEIENEIARQTKSVVNKDHIDFTIGLLIRDITNSGLELERIIETIRTSKDRLVLFGVKLLSRHKNEILEEDYSVGEEPLEKTEVIASDGLGIGFGIQYAIYFSFLSQKRISELTDYIKKSKIPKAAAFSKRLQQIFNQING